MTLAISYSLFYSYLQKIHLPYAAYVYCVLYCIALVSISIYATHVFTPKFFFHLFILPSRQFVSAFWMRRNTPLKRVSFNNRAYATSTSYT